MNKDKLREVEDVSHLTYMPACTLQYPVVGPPPPQNKKKQPWNFSMS
jgi:hypothetical protein